MENEVLKQIQSVIPTTKLGVSQMALKLTQALENGEIDALELLKTFKMMDTLKETIKEKLRECAIDQAEKYPEKEVELFGCVFKKMEAGVQYDFSGCNDRMFENISKMEADLKAEKEKRAKFLRSIDGHIELEQVDESTGEIVKQKVYPPLRTSTTTVQVTLK